jgi:aspartyl-tRNA(Asn)/glutamyl-tRNA(Gln) amidotransferase subunit B
MRLKETSEDYRYFPEPDLPPLSIDASWLRRLRDRQPELPAARRARYQAEGVKADAASALVSAPDLLRMYEELRDATAGIPRSAVANWVTQEYASASNTRRDRDPYVGHADPAGFGELIRLVDAGEISRANGREVLLEHIESGERPLAIVGRRGLRQISDTSALDALVDEVLAANPAAVADVAAGKPQAIGFLVGQVMKASKGQANAALVQAAVRARTGGG